MISDLEKSTMRQSPGGLTRSAAEVGRLDDVPPADLATVRILDTLALLVRQRKFLFAIVGTGLLLSIAVAFLIPIRYEAVARLMPPDQSAGMSSTMLSALTAKAGDSVGALAGDLLGMHTTGATLVGILSSRTIQDDLIDRFNLRSVYLKGRYDSARKVLAQRTDISEDRKSGIITIKVQDHSPDRAALLARGYIDDLNARVSQLTTSSAHRERVFLESRLTSIKQQLDQSTLQLSRFSSTNKTFDPQMEGRAMLDAASSLQGQLIAAESELKGVEQIYGPDNAKVRSANARIAELRAKLNALSGANAGTSAKGATPGGDALYPSLQQLPLLGNTYYDLARQAKINEAVYEALTKQYELAKVEEAKEIPTIKVLDEPIVPERKIWPPRMLIIILGAILTFCLGVVWIVARNAWESMDSTHPRRLLLVQVQEILSLHNQDQLQRPNRQI